MLCLTALGLILHILPISCVPNADQQFDDFHRAYERDSAGRSPQRRAASSSPALATRLVQYTDGNVTLTGYVAYDASVSALRPVVLVLHDWDGRDEFEDGKAEALARLGYVGFAIDVYGGKGGTTEQNQALMKPFRENRQLYLQRLQLGLDEAKKINVVDQNKIGAIGFCFGGMGVLDMARAGWPLRGIVSFHGNLSPPPQQQDVPVVAKILVLHGHDDPGIPPSAVESFEQEMTSRKSDWQVHVYSNTVHAFTVPTANSTGAKYNPLTDKRSWLTMKDFFQEVFA